MSSTFWHLQSKVHKCGVFWWKTVYSIHGLNKYTNKTIFIMHIWTVAKRLLKVWNGDQLICDIIPLLAAYLNELFVKTTNLSSQSRLGSNHYILISKLKFFYKFPETAETITNHESHLNYIWMDLYQILLTQR